MDFKALKAALDEGQRQNFYIFTGEEKAIMKKYIKRIDPNAREAESFQSLAVRFQNVGLFNNGEHGTYFIYNDKTVMSMDLTNMIRLIGPDKVILIYDELDGRTSFYKSAKSFVYEFPKLESEDLAKYVKSLININTDVAIELSRLCNNEVARVELECDKLSRLGRDVTMDLIHELVAKKAEDVVFDMVKAVASRKTKAAYSLLEELKERKESPVKIVSLLYTSFRNIVMIQSYANLSNQEIANKTGLSTGQIFFNRELCNCFSLEDLKDILILIQQAEADIKTGKMDQHIVLEVLLLSILR